MTFLYIFGKFLASLRLKLRQSHNAPKLSMYSLKSIETKNDMPFCLVETSEGICLLSHWKHVIYLFKYLAFLYEPIL